MICLFANFYYEFSFGFLQLTAAILLFSYLNGTFVLSFQQVDGHGSSRAIISWSVFKIEGKKTMNLTLILFYYYLFELLYICFFSLKKVAFVLVLDGESQVKM